MLLPSTYLSDTSHMTERSFPNRQNRPAAAASQPVDPIDLYIFSSSSVSIKVDINNLSSSFSARVVIPLCTHIDVDEGKSPSI